MSKFSNSDNDHDERLTREQSPSMPRWVKFSLIIVVILILLFLITHLFGNGGKNGPMRHLGETSFIEYTEVQQS